LNRESCLNSLEIPLFYESISDAMKNTNNELRTINLIASEQLVVRRATPF
jgi:hypothetical protein